MKSASAVHRLASAGFVGLGQIGLPIARNFLAAGVALRVHNRTPEKAAFPSKLRNGDLV